jgi:hypothetical protein
VGAAARLLEKWWRAYPGMNAGANIACSDEQP